MDRTHLQEKNVLKCNLKKFPICRQKVRYSDNSNISEDFENIKMVKKSKDKDIFLDDHSNSSIINSNLSNTSKHQTPENITEHALETLLTTTLEGFQIINFDKNSPDELNSLSLNQEVFNCIDKAQDGFCQSLYNSKELSTSSTTQINPISENQTHKSFMETFENFPVARRSTNTEFSETNQKECETDISLDFKTCSESHSDSNLSNLESDATNSLFNTFNTTPLNNISSLKRHESCFKNEIDQNLDDDFSKPRIPGVRYDTVGHRWVASWSSGGKQIQKYFPNKKFGNGKAREMAINARKQALEFDISSIKHKQTVKDAKTNSKTFRKKKYSIQSESHIPSSQSSESSEKPNYISLESKQEPTKGQSSAEILDKTLFVLIPNQSLLVSIPAIIERVPIINSNSEYSNSQKATEIISLPDFIKENNQTLTHITPETIKSAKDLATRICNSLFPKGIS